MEVPILSLISLSRKKSLIFIFWQMLRYFIKAVIIVMLWMCWLLTIIREPEIYTRYLSTYLLHFKPRAYYSVVRYINEHPQWRTRKYKLRACFGRRTLEMCWYFTDKGDTWNPLYALITHLPAPMLSYNREEISI